MLWINDINMDALENRRYSDDPLENSVFRDNEMRLPGPALGRPKQMTSEKKKQSYTDNTDRIEVERGFSLAKRCYGLGLLHTKLDITTRSSIALSIIAMNVSCLAGIILRCMVISIFSRCRWKVKNGSTVSLSFVYPYKIMLSMKTV